MRCNGGVWIGGGGGGTPQRGTTVTAGERLRRASSPVRREVVSYSSRISEQVKRESTKIKRLGSQYLLNRFFFVKRFIDIAFAHSMADFYIQPTRLQSTRL